MRKAIALTLLTFGIMAAGQELPKDIVEGDIEQNLVNAVNEHAKGKFEGDGGKAKEMHTSVDEDTLLLRFVAATPQEIGVIGDTEVTHCRWYVNFLKSEVPNFDGLMLEADIRTIAFAFQDNENTADGSCLYSEYSEAPCALGYCMGQIITEESRIETETGYHVYEPDNDHFTYFFVYHTPKSGVCRIWAANISERMAFADITKKFVNKYGEPIDKDDDKHEKKQTWKWELPQMDIDILDNYGSVYPFVRLRYTFANHWEHLGGTCKQEASRSIPKT